MNDHLPECPANWGVGDMPEGPCLICQMLRACEQRVSSEFLTPMALAATGLDDPRYAKGYAAGLDAAREAVAALDIGRDVRFSVDVQADALAAIDALRYGEINET